MQRTATTLVAPVLAAATAADGQVLIVVVGTLDGGSPDSLEKVSRAPT